jgi:hypothetical protein
VSGERSVSVVIAPMGARKSASIRPIRADNVRWGQRPSSDDRGPMGAEQRSPLPHNRRKNAIGREIAAMWHAVPYPERQEGFHPDWKWCQYASSAVTRQVVRPPYYNTCRNRWLGQAEP